MAGYTRQSASDIVTDNIVEAAPVNKEYNQIQAAFSGTTGHAHDGSTGNAPKINLTTSVTGILPVANGGSGLSSFADGKVLIGGDTALDITKDAPTGDFVGTTDTQTLTNKTLTSPTITGATLTTIDTISFSDASAARTALGLGTVATTNVGAYATAAQGTKADNALAKASNLSDLANKSSARANLGLGTIATHDASEFQSSEPSNVLAQIKTVDGSGSGLDSDLLDGYEATYFVNIPARLGYTPVQQGTGTSQLTNDIKIGWDGSSKILIQVDASPLGELMCTGRDGAGSGYDADLLDGHQGSYYQDASNITTGTLATSRLSGTYPIHITGNANTIDNLNSTQFVRSDTSDSMAGNYTVSGWFRADVFESAQNTSVILATQNNSGSNVIYFRPNGQSSGTGQCYINNGGTFTASGNVTAFSDERLKTDIKDLNGSLDLINSLRPVEYIKDSKLEIGLIAQEVEKHIPEVVFEGKYDEDLGFAPKTIDYSRLVVDLIGAVKELTEQNTKMHQRILELEIKALK